MLAKRVQLGTHLTSEQHDSLTPWSLLAFHHLNTANLDQVDQPSAGQPSAGQPGVSKQQLQPLPSTTPHQFVAWLTSPLPLMALTCKQHAHSSSVGTQSRAPEFRPHTEQVYPDLLVLKHVSRLHASLKYSEGV